MSSVFRALLRPELAELSSYVPLDPPGIVARLDANEAPAAASPEIREVVGRALARVALERYPDARARELKDAIALRTGARPEELLIGTGSDEVISLLLNGASRPREGAARAVVLSPTPTFVMYRVTASAHGARSVEVPLDAAWDLDVAAMKRQIDEHRPNVVFCASPNNPTSNRMSEERIAQLVEAARDAIVVVDEAYIDYAGASLRGWRARYPNLAILRTLSKIGLAALRVGWLEADAELVRELDKGRQPFNVSATSQVAAAAVMVSAWGAVRAEVERVLRERERVKGELARVPGLAMAPADANFLWIRTDRPAADVVEGLAARGVLVRSFHSAGGRLAHQVRVTIGTERENDLLLEAVRGALR